MSKQTLLLLALAALTAGLATVPAIEAPDQGARSASPDASGNMPMRVFSKSQAHLQKQVRPGTERKTGGSPMWRGYSHGFVVDRTAGEVTGRAEKRNMIDAFRSHSGPIPPVQNDEMTVQDGRRMAVDSRAMAHE